MPYTLIHQFNTQHAHFRFKADCQGESVTWDTNFYTVEGFRAEKNIENTTLKQFIDIEPSTSDLMKLTVVLKVNEVNKPNILKMIIMIIMINQYKNLSFGRHEYG